MRFSTFIRENLDLIVDEWVLFARQLSPATAEMSLPALEDHCRPILTAIARDMETGRKAASGLGLFIVREIVRGHKGTIDVESSEASGTVFSVRLPRKLR
jgi:light-regulated signal transduction histidine kinase (bacteriophytochrome)